MSRTIKWAMDKLDSNISTDNKMREYYKVFNSIYYAHKAPTEDDCRLLGISMEQAKELRKDGYRFENGQRRDGLNFANYEDPTILETTKNPKKKILDSDDK